MAAIHILQNFATFSSQVRYVKNNLGTLSLCEQINMETLLKCGNIPSQKSGIAFKSCSTEKAYTMTISIRSFLMFFGI